ncbi:MAG: hypothetical protein AAFX06_32960 [Planctomycetota bacterium]
MKAQSVENHQVASSERFYESTVDVTKESAVDTAFVDLSVEPLQDHLESLPDSVREIVFLSPVGDGLAQIVEHLNATPSCSGALVLARSSNGEMMLGSELHSEDFVQATLQSLLCIE